MTQKSDTLWWIDGELYYTDWREDDLKLFYRTAMEGGLNFPNSFYTPNGSIPVATMINYGAKLCGNSPNGVYKVTPNTFTVAQ